MNTMRRTTRIGLLLLLSLLLVACGGADDEGVEMEGQEGMSSMAMDLPADLDTATTRMTDQDLFEATITSQLEPVDINQIHSWILHLETPDGEPVEKADITISGGMPQHQHGFPTEPQVTEELGGGDYLVEGVKFSMGGWWEMSFSIMAGELSDSITFNIVLNQ